MLGAWRKLAAMRGVIGMIGVRGDARALMSLSSSVSKPGARDGSASGVSDVACARDSKNEGVDNADKRDMSMSSGVLWERCTREVDGAVDDPICNVVAGMCSGPMSRMAWSATMHVTSTSPSWCPF